MATKFEVNGKQVSVEVEPRMTLADCLRHELRLTGTHIGCEHGVCGACTVLVDGEAAAAEVEPQEDIHASAAYRRALTGTLTERALKAAAAR